MGGKQSKSVKKDSKNELKKEIKEILEIKETKVTKENLNIETVIPNVITNDTFLPDVNPDNPYEKCYSLKDIPKIDQTNQVKQMVMNNAMNNIAKLTIAEANKLVDDNYSNFTAHSLCQIILLNDTTLYSKIIGLNKGFLKSSKDQIELFEHVIISKNKILLKAYSIYVYAYSYTEFIYIMNLLARTEFEAYLIDFFKTNYNTAKTKTSDTNNNDILLFTQKMLNSKLKEDTLTSVINLTTSLEQQQLLDIYKLACDLLYNKYAILIFDKISIDSLGANTLYYACINKLTKLAIHLCLKDLTRDNFEVIVDGKKYYVLNIIIENDLYELFSHIISNLFSNSGKIFPEKKDGILGRCYILAHKLDKKKYKDILEQHVTFEKNILRKNDLDRIDISVTNIGSRRSDFINEPSLCTKNYNDNEGFELDVM